MESCEDSRVIYFAGGCFWGTEMLMQSIPGVTDAVSGYANGAGAAEANYPAVCTGSTGFRETVQVVYNPASVSLEKLLLAYFYVIDPTVANRQGADVGSQYQAGVYWADEASGQTVRRIGSIEAAGVKPFRVELKPLESFFPAEEYHQDYLIKNPLGYCHIPRREIDLFHSFPFEAAEYTRPAKALVAERLKQ